MCLSKNSPAVWKDLVSRITSQSPDDLLSVSCTMCFIYRTIYDDEWVSVLTTASNQIALRRRCRFSNSSPICLMACEVVFARNCLNNDKLTQYAWKPTISYYGLWDCIGQTYFCAIIWRKTKYQKTLFFNCPRRRILLLEPCIISIGKATKHTCSSLSAPDEYVQVSLYVRAGVRTDLAFVLGSAARVDSVCDDELKVQKNICSNLKAMEGENWQHCLWQNPSHPPFIIRR